MQLILWLVMSTGVAVLAITSLEIENEAREVLETTEEEFMPIFTEYLEAAWNYSINITHYNLEKKLNLSSEAAELEKIRLGKLMKFKWKEFGDESLKRRFKLNSIIGDSALPTDLYNRKDELRSKMSETYSTAKVCDYRNRTKCDLSLEPELMEVFKSSRDPEELSYYWKEWRDATGRKSRQYYKEYIELINEIVRLNNFTDRAEMLNMEEFDSKTFESDIQALWSNMEPLYKDLHAYVRGRLNQYYGDDVVSKDGPIPCHLLGNIWSQVWAQISDITIPYPDKVSIDVTQEMIKQGYTPLKMFKMAEDFFVSLNMSRMPQSFWEKSVIEKPKDRDIVCHASASDLNNGKDFRIKMCSVVNQQTFEIIHHEMGHIQYFIQYKDQPLEFRGGANSGFHEAIGDVISMSTATPKHLKRIGLLPEDFEQDKESSINFLLLQAMDKIATLPYIYLLDQWRWDSYRGNATEEDYNCHYWKLRVKYQGIQPPVERSEEDLDPFAKYHVAVDMPYIRYFVSSVLQYQFHKSLCETAGEYDPKNPDENPLYDCDIYKSVKAGEKFKKMMQMGLSKPWPEALEVMTGTKEMSTDDLLEYFKPLQNWLQKENERKGYKTGWSEPTVNICKKS